MREGYTFPLTVNQDYAATILANLGIPAMMRVVLSGLDTQGLLAKRSNLSALPMERNSLSFRGSVAVTRASTKRTRIITLPEPTQQRARALQTGRRPWLSRETLPWPTAGRRTENRPQ